MCIYFSVGKVWPSSTTSSMPIWCSTVYTIWFNNNTYTPLQIRNVLLHQSTFLPSQQLPPPVHCRFSMDTRSSPNCFKIPCLLPVLFLPVTFIPTTIMIYSHTTSFSSCHNSLFLSCMLSFVGFQFVLHCRVLQQLRCSMAKVMDFTKSR